jgi:hypothetical protein
MSKYDEYLLAPGEGFRCRCGLAMSGEVTAFIYDGDLFCSTDCAAEQRAQDDYQHEDWSHAHAGAY